MRVYITLHPRSVPEHLCYFLAIPFEEQMLWNYPEVAALAVLPHETWEPIARLHLQDA